MTDLAWTPTTELPLALENLVGLPVMHASACLPTNILAYVDCTADDGDELFRLARVVRWGRHWCRVVLMPNGPMLSRVAPASIFPVLMT
jgi:hypothetical protein